jgi:hypothetical protein
MVPVECIVGNVSLPIAVTWKMATLSYLKSLFSSISSDATAVLLHIPPLNRNTVAIFLLLLPRERIELVMAFAHYDS